MTKVAKLSPSEKRTRLSKARDLMADGKNTRQAAQEVGLSWQYISHHMKPVKEKPATEITLDMVEDVIIDRFERAARVPALEEENKRLRNSVAAYKNTNEQLKQKCDELENKDKRIRLALQQGEVKTPLIAK